MRRVHRRGRENILKRLVVQAGAANLGRRRNRFGVGTPKSLQGRVVATFSVVDALKNALSRLWLPLSGPAARAFAS